MKKKKLTKFAQHIAEGKAKRHGFGQVSDKSVAQQQAMIRYEPIFWPHLCQPHGMLETTKECAALWYYALCARQTYEAHKDDFQLEGDIDTADMPVQTNYLQLFTSIATMYNVEPAAMAKCWPLVDAQFWISKIPKVPDEDKYRHNKTVDIVIN